ncbi:hypothetical protein vBKpnAMK6_00204 [Klebsiella phage vB_Kpn_AM_K6]
MADNGEQIYNTARSMYAGMTLYKLFASMKFLTTILTV